MHIETMQDQQRELGAPAVSGVLEGADETGEIGAVFALKRPYFFPSWFSPYFWDHLLCAPTLA